MGCVVGTLTDSTENSHDSCQCQKNYPIDGDYQRSSTHAEKPAESPLPSAIHQQQQERGHTHFKVDDNLSQSGSEEKTSTETYTTQPHQVSVARRHKLKRSTTLASSGQQTPPLSTHDVVTARGVVDGAGSSNNTTTATTAATAAAAARSSTRQSRLSLRSSPFLSSPTQQQRHLPLESALAHTASATVSAHDGTAGSDRVGNSEEPFGSKRNTTTSTTASTTTTSATSADNVGAPASTQPQFPQYNQSPNNRVSSAVSISNNNYTMRESMLSDISTTVSTVSTTTVSVPELISPSHGGAVGGRNSIKTGAFRSGEDLEAQRQQVSLGIEEDLFIYDDIVISKDEARTKHWRLAGRKPPMPIENSTSDSISSPGQSSRGSSLKGKNYFTFNDFDVCVDEMDWKLATTRASTGIACLQQGNESATTRPDLKSITMTNTVALNPNTVAHFEAQARLTNPKLNRPLRDFRTLSLLGHATRVKCIALSPAETDYASCSNEDASISLNNFGVNSEVGIFTGHQDTIINATFSPDGKYLATTSKDKTMILWDVMTTKNLLVFTHPKVVICCCFGPDSKYLVSGCQDRACRLWDTKRGKEWLSYTGHDGIIIAVAFSPDGTYVCSASADKSLRVWSATTAKTRFHLTGHTGVILSCSYTTDGRHIVSNDEFLLCVWSAEDGSCTLSLGPADIAGAALLNARGPRLGWTLSCAAPGAFTGYMLVACNNRFVYVLDIETGAEVTSAFCKAPVYCLTAGSYEKVACGDSFGNIYILTMK